MNSLLTPPQPPRLPDPGGAVDVRYVNALLSVLRLFFNQLQRVVALITGDNGARFLQTPFGEFYSTAAQTAVVNTATPVDFGVWPAGNGVSIVGGQALTPVFTGVYQVRVGLQFANAGATLLVSVWLRINGTDVAASCRDIEVDAGGGQASLVWLLPLTGEDAVTVIWSTPNVSASLAPQAARVTPTRPVQPSAVATVLLVSAALNE